MKISIAMCTYNGSRYLEQQLRSIADQTHQPSELVICDDGSTDRTEQILSDFRNTVGFSLRYHRNAINLGSTKNFEQAIQLCTGDVIALCDQDDVWFPQKLERMSAELEARPEAAGVFSNARLIDENGALQTNDLWQMAGFTAQRQRRFQDPRQAPYVLIEGDTVTGAAFMFRASFVPQVTPFSTAWIHDGWIALLMTVTAGLVALPEHLMSYRLHTSQQVGVRQVPWHEHLSTRKQDAIASHRLLSQRCTDMADTIEQMGDHDEIVAELRRKARYYARRHAALQGSLATRLIPLARLLPDYFHYSQGLMSLFRDLLH
jgi:glycosyltransferase involved in cell wall biosynthesis